MSDIRVLELAFTCVKRDLMESYENLARLIEPLNKDGIMYTHDIVCEADKFMKAVAELNEVYKKYRQKTAIQVIE